MGKRNPAAYTAYQHAYYAAHRQRRNTQIREARWRKAAGHAKPRGNPRKRWTAARLRRLVGLRKQGKTLSELAEMYQVSTARIAQLLGAAKPLQTTEASTGEPDHGKNDAHP